MDVTSSFEHVKETGRVTLGALLHHVGLYHNLLPVRLPHPAGWRRRLQDYLRHYYESASHVEAVLAIPELRVTFACDLRDHMLLSYVEGTGPLYEQTEIDYFCARTRSGDHIVDIGANHGFWGMSLARAAGTGAVAYLFEANPTILHRLRRTVRLNPDLRTCILPYAVTDGSCDAVTFYLPSDNLSGLGSTVLHEYATTRGYLNERRHVTVPTRSLDTLMETGVLRGMDLMKVDVERGEDAVIAGGCAALRQFGPRLLMVETAKGSFAYEELIKLGYRAYCLDDRGSEIPLPTGKFWGNILFARDGGAP